MSAFELSGTIARIMEAQTFSSGFTKREFVLNTDDKYPQMVKFECIKERCALLDGVREGDHVTVGFRIRGSEFKERFYVNLQAFNVAATGAPPAEADGGGGGHEPPLREPDEKDGGEDMPF